MQTNGPISKAYFRFLTDIVCDNYHRVNYAKLLKDLYAREFIWSVEKDVNRSMDGIDLREDFKASQNHYPYDIIDESFKGQPCSVFEMMVAMARRCENEIMVDRRYGDRTGYWFWEMIDNLELTGMTDENYDYQYVLYSIDIFLHRRYRPDGTGGGMFYKKDSRFDFRKTELWYQMQQWLDNFD